eukprot:CAMPEP_0194270796 /NCGR_PEP_ID=MMETSP0169-20130528/4709_1 /TAXON_ID=218684 /ORGANISM="Corethron pennatum, Strain L29A3" /LENGTH=719 /DNA_ID=CAMNT_0039012967 /DNA_START=103 /DNA_END=2259 /DNA_ORIENTATION=-
MKRTRILSAHSHHRLPLLPKETVSSSASSIQNNSEKGHETKIPHIIFFLIPLLSITPFLLITLTTGTVNTIEKSHLGLGLSRHPPLSHAVVNIEVDDELGNQFNSTIADLKLFLTSTLDFTEKKTVLEKIRSFVNNIDNSIEYGEDNVPITHDIKNDPNSATEFSLNSQAKQHIIQESAPRKIEHTHSSVKNNNGSSTDDADSDNSKNNVAINSKLVPNGAKDNFLDETIQYSEKANENRNYHESTTPKKNGVHSKNNPASPSKTVIQHYTPKNQTTTNFSLRKPTPEKIKGVLPLSMASPKIIRGYTYTFPSIPAEKRVYPNKERNNEKEPDTLYVYNPTIIPIPSSYLPYLVFNSTQQKPSYLISFRVSAAQSCHADQKFKPIWHNLIGLAVLDLRLKLIPGSDVVFNTNAVFNTKKQFEDVRLFVLNEKVHLSHRFELFRILVSTPNTRIPPPHPSEKYFPIPTKYGNGLNVQAVKYIQGENTSWWKVTNVPRRLITLGAKNFNYITSKYTPGQYFLDFTMGEWLAPVNVGNNTMGKMFQRSVKPRPSFQSSISPIGNDSGFSVDRGTACCSRIESEYYSDLHTDPSIKELSHILVGILHAKTKTKELNSMGGESFVYMSRLYALSPHPPFDMLARSGLLCFGFGDEVETKEEPFAKFAAEKKVVINDQTETCPVIHFASGLTEKIDDNSTLIVGYGINDCVGRFAEISKREFAKK